MGYRSLWKVVSERPGRRGLQCLYRAEKVDQPEPGLFRSRFREYEPDTRIYFRQGEQFQPGHRGAAPEFPQGEHDPSFCLDRPAEASIQSFCVALTAEQLYICSGLL